MEVLTKGDPREILHSLDYKVVRFRKCTTGSSFQHGIFRYGGKRYMIEFVRSIQDIMQEAKWVIARIYVFERQENTKIRPVIIYDFKEILMAAQKLHPEGKIFVNSFLVLLDRVPLVAIHQSVVGITHVYEMEDLCIGQPMQTSDCFVRFLPKPYERVLQLKSIAAWALEKKFTLLSHEESREKYDDFIRVWQNERDLGCD